MQLLLLCDSVQFFWVLFAIVISQRSFFPRLRDTALSWISELFQEWPTNCVLPTMSGMCNFPCQGLALLETVPRPPITIGITVTLDALWILFYYYYYYYYYYNSFLLLLLLLSLLSLLLLFFKFRNKVLKKIKKVSFILGKFSVARSNRYVTQCLFRHL